MPPRVALSFATAVSPAPAPRRLPPALRALSRAVTRPLSDGLTLADHLLAGAAAAGTAVASMHPLDTVKTVVQAAGSQRRSTFAAFASVLSAGGLPALYKGLPISLSAQIPAGAIKFAAFETLTQLATNLFPDRAGTPAVEFACAAMAFVCCSVVMVPGELLKQRLQANMYPGLRSAVTTIARTEGPAAFYTGYSATLFRDIPYTMLEFGLYGQFKRAMRALVRKDKLSPREEIFMGGIAGGFTGFLTTPLDLAKTRLMTQSAASGAKQYKGVVDVLTQVGRTEGLGGLFKGSLARTAWLIPFTAVWFGVHEASKRALLERKSRMASVSKTKES